MRFDTLRSIARRSRYSVRVTLLDGREIGVFGSREVGKENRGIYRDDPRYGRVLVSGMPSSASTRPDRLDRAPGSPGPNERGAARAGDFHSGEEVQLEHAGDLGLGNAGLLIFVEGQQRPEYVPWSDVGEVDFDRPQASDPPA
jgi:hypothetical protein